MAVLSMTGFARHEERETQESWSWEIRSVNHRSLDIRCRLPNGLDRLEVQIRRQVAAKLRRGSVALTLQIEEARPQEQYRINRSLLASLTDEIATLQETFGAATCSADGLLALPGILERVPPSQDPGRQASRDQAILSSFDRALDHLIEARAQEGRHLQTSLETLLDEMTVLIEEAARLASLQPAALQARLRQQLGELLQGHPLPSEERLAQEVALLVLRGDGREELDRLRGHVHSARRILETGGEGSGAGRSLDFLAQEFAREANTFCAKAASSSLTDIGLRMKLTIDRLREQVQNIE